MTLETFFEKFDQFADAPHAVAKMRELVLQWAVQGRLVRQDCNEEPASSLIRGAVRARRTLVAAKAVRDAAADLSFLDELENGLPPGWVYAPLSVYVGVIMGQSPPSSAYNETGEGLPFYQGKAQFGRLYPTATDWCTEPTKIGEPEDVVISVRAPVGPTNMLRERSCIGRGLASLRSLGGDQMHLLYTLRAVERDLAAMGVGSTFAAISKSDLDDFRIPVPPLGEQKRIVKKVDQLMELCDRLEAQQQQREERHADLASAAMARFADAPTPANLQLLFHPSYAISPLDLRKTILTLAVRGSLVPQDPADEPAHQLLQNITRQRASLQRSDSLRKTKPCRPMRVDNIPNDIPPSWAWTMLGEIADIGTGSTPSTTERSFWTDGTIPWVTSGSTSRSPITDADALVTPDAVKAHRLRLYPQGTLLVALYGQGKTRGQVAVLGIQASINQACAAVCSIEGVPSMQGYLKLLLERQYDEMRSLSAGGAQPNLNVQKIKEVLVPLPPFAEQRRIVAKVEELMALVDQLESQLVGARAAAANLLAAAVAELTSPAR